MNSYELVIPTLFGIEAVVAREVRDLGYETTEVSDGRVCFLGDDEAIVRVNLCIRSGERVLIKVGEFEARTFTELFDGCRALDWPRWIPKHGAFPVKGHSVRSTLFSVPDCQKIIKKSVADTLGSRYSLGRMPEDGELYQIQFSILKDRVTLMIDTSGEGLHKRGYRKDTSNRAPIRETLAAAMVQLSFWNEHRILCDPFCGSGTIPIEAAMIAKNMAPGLRRSFAAEEFSWLDKSLWEEIRQELQDQITEAKDTLIYASDIDPACVRLTMKNASAARVDPLVRAGVRDVRDLKFRDPRGIIITNPPYGERLGDAKEAKALSRVMGQVFPTFPDWSYYIITPDEDFEKDFGKKASKKRKLYNGMIRCQYYQYFAPKK
ncbi:MAG: class I SAM-dependent RNA methyltransferase [Clostridia bacterium]|nr:class I SAM-dependent RNA methyltransferase [Clostridia bacterium]